MQQATQSSTTLHEIEGLSGYRVRPVLTRQQQALTRGTDDECEGEGFEHLQLDLLSKSCSAAKADCKQACTAAKADREQASFGSLVERP